MARALIAGLLRQGLAATQIRVGEPLAAAASTLESQFGVTVTADNQVAVDAADLVVLAVKPQEAAKALRPLHSVWPASAVLLSIAAGLRIAELARLCPGGTAVVRAMPNRPAMVGAGVTALYAPPSVSPAQRALAALIATASGQAVWVPREADIDVVTALSGSGPAYFFLLAEQMAQAAQALGLAAETANELAVATLHGAGLLARAAPDLAAQREAVTSKGGTTEAALQVLRQGGFDALVGNAVRAAATRSIELADGLAQALAGS